MAPHSESKIEEFTFPTVDISDFEKRKTQVSAELGHAAREIGFFRVTGKYRTLKHHNTALQGRQGLTTARYAYAQIA